MSKKKPTDPSKGNQSKRPRTERTEARLANGGFHGLVTPDEEPGSPGTSYHSVQESDPPDPNGALATAFSRFQLEQSGYGAIYHPSDEDPGLARPQDAGHPAEVNVYILAPGEQLREPGLSVIADLGQDLALKIFMKFLRSVRYLMRPLFGDVLFIREGCIVLSMFVQSEQILNNYMATENIAQMERQLKDFVLSHASDQSEQIKGDIAGMRVFINRDDVQRVRYFFQADTLPDAVTYTFCAEENCWYWSPDGKTWMRENVFIVQSGNLEGMKPQQEDLAFLAKLWSIKNNPCPNQRCRICSLANREVFKKDVYWKSIVGDTESGVYSGSVPMEIDTSTDVRKELFLAPEDTKEAEDLVGKEQMEKSMRHVDSVLRQNNSRVLHVAVMGGRACGKSSFIDAARDIDVDHEGAAAATATVDVPTPHFNDENSGVVFWDVPPPARVALSSNDYKGHMRVDKYDICILLCSRHLTNEELFLIDILRELKKEVIYVHNKMDAEVDVPVARSNSDELSEREARLHDDILQQLRENHVALNSVFMVSSVPRTNVKFLDFPLILERLIERAPATHRTGVTLALGPHSENIIKKKEEALKDLTYQVALGSVLANLVPIAGTAVDVGIVSYAIKGYKKYFGVDKTTVEETINKYSIKGERFSPATKAFLALTVIALVSTILRGATLSLALTWSAALSVVGVLFIAPITYYRTKTALDNMIDSCRDASTDILKQVNRNQRIKHVMRKSMKDSQTNPYHTSVPTGRVTRVKQSRAALTLYERSTPRD